MSVVDFKRIEIAAGQCRKISRNLRMIQERLEAAGETAEHRMIAQRASDDFTRDADLLDGISEKMNTALSLYRAAEQAIISIYEDGDFRSREVVFGVSRFENLSEHESLMPIRRE